VVVNGAGVKTSPSIGVAVYPEHGTTQDRLYKSADLALYEAKRMAVTPGAGTGAHCHG